MHSEQDLKFFDRYGLKRPEHVEHGLRADELEGQLKQLKPHSWHLKGNQLVGMTAMGPLVQTIPTDRILTGTDENGLPVFKKVVLSNQKKQNKNRTFFRAARWLRGLIKQK